MLEAIGLVEGDPTRYGVRVSRYENSKEWTQSLLAQFFEKARSMEISEVIETEGLKGPIILGVCCGDQLAAEIKVHLEPPI